MCAANEGSPGSVGSVESGDEERGKQARGNESKRSLTLLPLAALIFYEVSGGPFGIEDAVSAGGAQLAIFGFLLLPLVWSLPEALVAAELATAFPENSGFVAWVTAAFGPFWGFQEGLWSWLSGVSDNAIYPVLFFAYLQEACPLFKQPLYHWPMLFGSVIGLTFLSYRGLTIVGTTAIVLTVFTLLPFVIFFFMAIPQVNLDNFAQPVVWEKVQWGPYLNCIFWNINYWDSASTLAGEVKDPRTTYPRGLMLALVVVVGCYLLPLTAGVGVNDPADEWREGYLVTLAIKVGGPALGIWVLAASAVSNIGQFAAEMSSDAFLLQGMAEQGMLPAVLAVRSEHGSPKLGLLLSSIGIFFMMFSTFTEVVELLNFLYCIAQLLELAAFMYLRIYAKDLPRKFVVPLNTWGCAAMLTLPVVFIFFIMSQATMRTIYISAAVVVAGPLVYQIIELARRRQWCEFNELNYYQVGKADTRTAVQAPVEPGDSTLLLLGPNTTLADSLESPLLANGDS